MTDTYELGVGRSDRKRNDDADDTSGADREPDGSEHAPADATDDGPEHETGDATGDDGSGADESLGVPIPDEHVGAFVAQAFEDTERRTEWSAVVDRFVPADARDDWRGLSMRERVVAVLDRAAAFDEEAADLLADISTDKGSPTPAIREQYDEALRCRRNADIFRDAVADAYASGRIDDDDLVAAVEAHGFSTDLIARREEELDRVANAFDFEFRPYGGTLFDTDDDSLGDEFEAW